MTLVPSTPDELAGLRAESAHMRRVNEELLATVAELRATVEKQQAHIERLVRMTFGRRSERVAGRVDGGRRYAAERYGGKANRRRRPPRYSLNPPLS